MQWEYETYTAEKWDPVATNLKILGERGWELVQAFESQISTRAWPTRNRTLVFILKRPLDQGN